MTNALHIYSMLYLTVVIALKLFIDKGIKSCHISCITIISFYIEQSYSGIKNSNRIRITRIISLTCLYDQLLRYVSGHSRSFPSYAKGTTPCSNEIELHQLINGPTI